MWGPQVESSCIMASVFSVKEKVRSAADWRTQGSSCCGTVTRRNRGVSKSGIKTWDVKTQWRLEERKAVNRHRASVLSVKKFLLLCLVTQVGEKKRQILHPIQDVQLAECVEHNEWPGGTRTCWWWFTQIRASDEEVEAGGEKNREVKEQETSLRMNRFRRKGVEEEER